MQSILWKGFIEQDPGATVPTQVRAILVMFTANEGDDPGLNAILQDVGTSEIAMVSQYKRLTSPSQPYRILLDRRLLINFSGTNPTVNFNFKMKFKKPVSTFYTSSLGVVGAINKNLIKLFVFSSGQAANSDAPFLTYSFRSYYTDV